MAWIFARSAGASGDDCSFGMVVAARYGRISTVAHVPAHSFCVVACVAYVALGVGQRCPAATPFSKLSLCAVGQPPLAYHFAAHWLDCRAGCAHLPNYLAVAAGLFGYIFLLLIKRASCFNTQQNKLSPFFAEENIVKHSILLVDDEPNLRELLRHMLEIGGFEVIEAEDGLDALAKLDELMPDVMILDVMMPVLDGVSLCKQLRATEKFATLPIVMLSGKTQYKAVQEGLAAGADRYLCKPITVDELVQTVREVLSTPAALARMR